MHHVIAFLTLARLLKVAQAFFVLDPFDSSLAWTVNAAADLLRLAPSTREKSSGSCRSGFLFFDHAQHLFSNMCVSNMSCKTLHPLPISADVLEMESCRNKLHVHTDANDQPLKFFHLCSALDRMAEQAQNEEAESQVAAILANDAKFWRDQASWEATGGLQSSGDARLAQETVSRSSAESSIDWTLDAAASILWIVHHQRHGFEAGQDFE